MPELGPLGSVRGAAGNSRPYRERYTQSAPWARELQIHERHEAWQRMASHAQSVAYVLPR